MVSNRQTRVSVRKAWERDLPVYFLIFYDGTRWPIWKAGDTIKLSGERTYLTEGSQIRNRFLDLRNELKLVSVCLHKSSAQRSFHLFASADRNSDSRSRKR